MHRETLETLALSGSSSQPHLPKNQKSNHDLIAILGLSLGLILFFYPALFDGKVFFYRDIMSFAYPYKFFQVDSWLQGAFPFWHPLIFGGSPVMELMHTGVFYPLNIVLFWSEFWFGFNLYIILHYFILVFSVYALARHWGLAVIPAFCSSVTALFGGYFLSLASLYNHLQSAVWFPLILLFFLKFLEKGYRRYFFTLVALFVCQILGGSPESFALSTGIIILYTLYIASENHNRTTRFKTIFLLGVAILFALGLSAIQLIPTYELMESIVRGKGIQFEASTAMSLSPSALWHFIIPINFLQFMQWFKFGTGYFIQSFYMGLIPMIFLLSSAIFILRGKVVRFWLAIFLLGVFFALGKHNPFYQFFFDWVPPFNKFRYPEKFLFLSAFALVFLVGYGVQFIEELATKSSKQRKAFYIFLSLFCLVIFIRSLFKGTYGLQDTMIVVLPFLATFYLFSQGKIKKEIFFVILLALMMIDLLKHNIGLVPFIDKNYFNEPPELIAQLPNQKDPYRVYSGPVVGSEKVVTSKNRFPDARDQLSSMYLSKERLYPNISSIYGVSSVDGLTGLDIKEDNIWTSIFIMSPTEKRLRMLKRGNVKYWVTEEDAIEPELEHPFGLKKIELFADALPRAFLVPKARKLENKETVNLYFSESFDPKSEVLLEEPFPEVSNNAFQGKVNGINYYPNGVTLQTKQNGDGFLVLLDSFFPGWSVKIDGKEDHIYRANYFFRAVKLGPGDHTVEFSFEPVGFRTGCWVSAFTILFLLVILFAPRQCHTILPLHKH